MNAIRDMKLKLKELVLRWNDFNASDKLQIHIILLLRLVSWIRGASNVGALMPVHGFVVVLLPRDTLSHAVYTSSYWVTHASYVEWFMHRTSRSSFVTCWAAHASSDLCVAGQIILNHYCNSVMLFISDVEHKMQPFLLLRWHTDSIAVSIFRTWATEFRYFRDLEIVSGNSATSIDLTVNRLLITHLSLYAISIMELVYIISQWAFNCRVRSPRFKARCPLKFFLHFWL